MDELIKHSKLEPTTPAMLKLLQSNGRLNNAELTKKLKMSPATCHRKMQQLTDEVYIAGFRALVNPNAVSRGALVMVGFVLDRSTPESFASFESAIKKLPFVLDCHLVAGDYDYLLKIRVRDMADFNKLHGEQLIAFPGVRQIRSFIVMKEVTDNAELDF